MRNPWAKKERELDFEFASDEKASKNSNLNRAKKEKNDEFYTRLEDIEAELSNYPVECFKDKIVYCPCDIPSSNFVKYFTEHKELGIKKLIHTSIQEGYDFRSDYCTQLLREADIVVTNPPFSLFREFVAILMEYNKKFIIIGNKNAITYKEFFPLLKDDEVWIGCNSPSEFSTPDGVTKKLNGLTRWFTNLDVAKRHEKLILWKQYMREEYPKYDNYDAINVDKVKDIPCDYNGVMGVPITFLDKYNPEQFEIVGCFNGFAEPDYKKGLLCGSSTEYIDNKGNSKYWTGPTINKQAKYSRILIRKKAEI